MLSSFVTLKLLFFFVAVLAIEEVPEGQDPRDKLLRQVEKALANKFGLYKYHKEPIDGLRHLDDLLFNGTTPRISLFDNAICSLCGTVAWKIKNNVLPLDFLVLIGCLKYTFWANYPDFSQNDLCKKLVDKHVPTTDFAVKNSKIVTPELACSILWPFNHCYVKSEHLDWKIDIKEPSSGKNLERRKDYNTKKLKILHLSDFHISMDYEVNGISKCGYFICCKPGLGNPNSLHDSGTFGSYSLCDLPKRTFIETLEYIKSNHSEIDLIYFTGDVVDHEIWDTSVQKNTETIIYVYKTLKRYFPNKIILPIVGNHEVTPINVFPPPYITQNEFSQKWLYNLLADLWSKFLPEDTLDTVRKEGYYTVAPFKNFRAIVLNNNVCYNYNWWLLMDTKFLMEQLNWFAGVLQKAEEQEEFVHILLHVPPGNNECIKPWQDNYSALIERYSHIIKGQFFGHTHTDEFKVFYDSKTQQPINVGFNGASLTTYENFNPSFKIYTVNPTNFEVEDSEQYTFNLTEANLTPHQSPKWFTLYSFKESFGLKNLSPSSMGLFAKELFVNESLIQQYYRYSARNGDPSIKNGCDYQCKKDLRCGSVMTNSFQHNIFDFCN